jgi:hypothetical protein
MKFYGFNIPKMIKAISTVLLFMFISGFALSQTQSGYDLKSILDVKGWWKGWLNDPDTIRVKADSTFTANDIDSLKKACSRWNAGGCRPALKVVTSGTGEINCRWGTEFSAEASAEAITYRANNLKVTGADIVFRPGNGYNFTELATHELGHPLGLLDTDTATHQKDVMTAKGDNGTLGKLSQHDSAEIARARVIVDSVWGAELPMAVKIGTRDTIPFKLPQTYPPVVSMSVNILGPAKYILFSDFWVLDDYFYIDCTVFPEHWAGMLFFEVNLLFQYPYGELSFLGSFITSNNPVPPISFECPFWIEYQGDDTYISWVNGCMYPIPDQMLRSDLIVTDLSDNTSFIVQNKDGGDYKIHLDPGTYEIKLEVDDFQVNSASYTQTITYTGMEGSTNIQTGNPIVFPNPFNNSCEITCKPSSSIMIFDSQGKIVDLLPPGSSLWKPSSSLPPGTYYMNIRSASGQVWSEKVIYLPKW